MKTNKTNIFEHITFVAMGILMVLSAALAFPHILPHARAASAPVSSESTITVDTEDIVVDARINPDGTSTFFKATSNLTISTNNYSGYTLRIVADDEDTHDKLINTTAGSCLESITEATSEQDFTDEASFVGKFGYNPSKFNSSENTDFLPAPDTTGDVLDVTSAANSGEGEENTYSISLGTKADITIPAGEYVNTYIYEVVANPVPYLITFDENTTDTVTNMPATQQDDTALDGIVLDSATPERAHYDFLGWCEGTTTNTITETEDTYTCDGTTYQPGDTFYLDQTTDNQVGLKAMWNIHQNRLDVNGRLDGSDAGNIANFGTVDVYINGNRVADDVTDYAAYWKYGTAYEVTDIKANTGKQYDGVQTSFPLSGTIGEEYIDLRLKFSTRTFTINLTNTSATTNGSTKATATYGSSSLTSITNPQRVYTISGLANNGSGGSGATVTFPTSGVCRATNNCKYTYGFKGWYTATSNGTQIIDTNGALTASNGWTNSSKQWTSTSNQTVYAQWNSGTAITLPTISKTGFTCGWATANNTTTRTYSSGQTNVTLTGNITLYGTCTANTYTLTVNFAGSGVSSVKVCKTSGNCSGSNLMGTVSSNGGTVSNLVYNTAYYLYPAFSTGYKFSAWAKTAGSGTLSSTSASNPTFTMGAGNGTVRVTGAAKTYTITLNRNGGNSGSTSTTATYGSTTWAAITVPAKNNTTETRAVSGFSAGTNASGASISSTSTLNSTRTTTYSFKGWYTASSGGTNVANTASTPALTANNGYTNGSKQWTYDNNASFYAQFNSSTGNWTSVKLPTISKTGYACGWSTSSTAANYSWVSGATITPSSAMTLYGICVDTAGPTTPYFGQDSITRIRVTSGGASFTVYTGKASDNSGSVTYTVFRNTSTALGSNTVANTSSYVVVGSLDSGLSGSSDSYTLRVRASDSAGNVTWDTSYQPTITGKRLYVRQMYNTFRTNDWLNIGSAVSESEVDFWLNELSSNQGGNKPNWIKKFFQSTEPTNAFNGMNKREVCKRLYQGILGRGADVDNDTGGLTNCTNALNSGTSYAQMAYNMASSSEAQNIYNKWGI